MRKEERSGSAAGEEKDKKDREAEITPAYGAANVVRGRARRNQLGKKG